MSNGAHTTRHRHTPLTWWFFSVALVAVIAGALGSAGTLYASRYSNRIFPGVAIGVIPVGGLTPEEAEEILTRRVDELMNSIFTFYLDGKKIEISPRVLAPTDPDLTRELITFDRTEALETALRIGRTDNIFTSAIEQSRVRYRSLTIPINATINKAEFVTALTNELASSLIPHRDAAFSIVWEGEAPRITIIPETTGTTIDEDVLIYELSQSLARLETPSITMATTADPPDINADDVASLVSVAEAILKKGPWTLRTEKKNWTITKERLAAMMAVKKEVANIPSITLSGPELETLFAEIEAEINQTAQDAKFKIDGTRVTEFQPSRDGIVLDRTATRAALIGTIINGGIEAEVVVKKSAPDVSVREVNNLGIEGVLGVGVSNFKGSPKNRIKNIKNGARLLNGTLIKPNEEFSLLAALRPFTTENGYLPELVIKGDKITPEIGGGLCQIGTTTFRATMNSGFPVTARRNHSLVVTYYNDLSNKNPGTDATIYDPAPDFKLVNDTGAHILLTTEVDMEKYELRFTFWGKSDGRKGYYSPPVVDRWFPTGPTVIVESTDLPPGKKECQSKHPGADAHFTYTVEKQDGTVNERVFESHYRPLPEICLVGVEKKTEEPAENQPNVIFDQTPEAAVGN